MTALKRFLLALTASLIMIPALPALATSHYTSGFIVVQVVDQDGNDIQGVWFLHQGSGEAGDTIRNGTWGETFSLPYGVYFLRGQRQEGYASFEVVSDNPQTILSRSYITYRLVYYPEGYPTPPGSDESAQGDAVIEEEAQDDGIAEEEAAAEEEVMEEVVTEEEMMEEEEEESPRIPGRSGLERSPLHVETPASSLLAERLAYTGGAPVQLAVTGPAGLLALMIPSMMGAWAILRRRR